MAELKKWVIDQNGYIDTKIQNESDDDTSNDTGVFRHKSRIYPKKLSVHVDGKDGKKVKKNITVDQKQMVYYPKQIQQKNGVHRLVMFLKNICSCHQVQIWSW